MFFPCHTGCISLKPDLLLYMNLSTKGEVVESACGLRDASLAFCFRNWLIMSFVWGVRVTTSHVIVCSLFQNCHPIQGVCVWKCCLLSCIWYFVIPWTVAYQAPLSMEFSRQEYWTVLPFPSPGDLPEPGIESRSPALQGYILWLSHQGSLEPVKSLGFTKLSPSCFELNPENEVRFSTWLARSIHRRWRRKWQPTPLFLPRESLGHRSLEGCCPWGRTESDTTELT